MWFRWVLTSYIQVIHLPPRIINSCHHTLLPPCDTWEKHDILIISTKQENPATKSEADNVITTAQQSPACIQLTAQPWERIWPVLLAKCPANIVNCSTKTSLMSDKQACLGLTNFEWLESGRSLVNTHHRLPGVWKLDFNILQVFQDRFIIFLTEREPWTTAHNSWQSQLHVSQMLGTCPYWNSVFVQY